MTVDLIAVAVGWLIGLLSAATLVRAHPGQIMGRQRPYFNATRSYGPRNWWVEGSRVMGVGFVAFGGSALQLRYLGWWALPLAFIPFVLFMVAPVMVHDIRVRRLQNDQKSTAV